MQLVSNWKQSWRWFSMQVLLLLAALQLEMAIDPGFLAKFVVSDTWQHRIAAILAVIGVYGRLISQKKDPVDCPQKGADGG